MGYRERGALQILERTWGRALSLVSSTTARVVLACFTANNEDSNEGVCTRVYEVERQKKRMRGASVPG